MPVIKRLRKLKIDPQFDICYNFTVDFLPFKLLDIK